MGLLIDTDVLVSMGAHDARMWTICWSQNLFYL
jgi:hypothetical protein